MDDQLASEIPFSGHLENLDVVGWKIYLGLRKFLSVAVHMTMRS